MVTLLAPPAAFAAAEVHRFNLVLSGTPTQVNAGEFNNGIGYYNGTKISPRGLDPLPKVTFSWLFDSEFRYFLMKNLALSAGVGHMRATSAREYLPALAQAINVSATLITVPVHLGAAYYLQAYNQGDFQARAFVGAGLESYTHSRTTFTQTLSGADSATTYQLSGSFRHTNTQDGSGYYAEAGVHMFFSSRYSVLLSALYRSGELNGLVDESTGLPVDPRTVDPLTGLPRSNPRVDKPTGLDVGGVGFRMAVVLGL